jgi:hypothetical protein
MHNFLYEHTKSKLANISVTSGVLFARFIICLMVLYFFSCLMVESSFVSDLNLPVGKDIFYVFSSEIMEEKISALAYVVWMNEMEGNGLYEYGAEFDVNEHERANIQKLLMRVQIKINKENMLFDEGNFVYGYPEDYFRMKRKKK